jgi:hypothetical protein
MSQIPVNPSPDILRLIHEGYEVEIRGAHLLISHVPYVNPARAVCFGTLVSTLALNGNVITKPDTHVVHFAGEHPCHRDGRLMSEIQHASGNTTLAEGIVVNHSFSNKPRDGYADYYEKMTRYVEVISAPARAIDPSAKAQTHRVIESKPDESVFNYHDTNSSRAEIGGITAKLKGYKIGIVGLGGTGSYVLDLVAKTPVEEIHLFDGDAFEQHNAFRAPGAPSLEQLRQSPPKVDYFAEIYSRMRRGIIPHPEFLNASNVALLRGLNFVFVCLDKGRVKQEIATFLEAVGASFVDVGMGVHIGENNLLGTVRVTASSPSNRELFRKHVSCTDAADNVYATNIQIADLNMLNAALAVLRWKKFAGFYQDLENEHHTTYSTNVNQFLCEKADA